MKIIWYLYVFLLKCYDYDGPEHTLVMLVRALRGHCVFKHKMVLSWGMAGLIICEMKDMNMFYF